jgi:hypothetical protein
MSTTLLRRRPANWAGALHVSAALGAALKACTRALHRCWIVAFISAAEQFSKNRVLAPALCLQMMGRPGISGRAGLQRAFGQDRRIS